MKTRNALGWLVLLLVGCSPQLGRVRISVVFENEARTQCIKASARNASGASVAGTPAAIPREGKDTLLIGLGETGDLQGEVRVTIARFTAADCSGTAFASETKVTEVVRGAATGLLEFRFSDGAADGGTDGGFDGGPGDAGADAGCDTGACGNSPGECETTVATGCQGDGGCRFGFRAPETMCATGVCNSMGACISDVCKVLDAGAACDDGLACTPSSVCSTGICLGSCPTAPVCNRLALPIACDLVTPTACALRPAQDLTACNVVPGGQCFDGGCLPWLQFLPSNFPSTLDTIPYPTSAWTLASPDGGVCDTIISTTGSAATLVQGDCGSPTITSTVNDAGVSVITMTGLDVGPAARLQFLGTRPVQLLVLGNASIRGTLSVAPLLGGQQPAGTQPASCTAVQAGGASKAGGGGGAFGGSGGRGGDSGGTGGTANGTISPLRGGCAGGAGFGTIPPGTGGGALQLIVADALTLNGGIVTASGGGGSPGTTDGEGGGGGGSGGTVIIEARLLNLTGGWVTANGGGGGQGGDSGETSAAGALGPIQSATAGSGG